MRRELHSKAPGAVLGGKRQDFQCFLFSEGERLGEVGAEVWVLLPVSPRDAWVTGWVPKSRVNGPVRWKVNPAMRFKGGPLGSDQGVTV